MILNMATYRVSEADAVRDFADLLARVRAGAEVVIESGSRPVAVVRGPVPAVRTLEEAAALLSADSKAVVDDDFARDVAAAIAAHQEPLNPPEW
jgi:prevent-host-death family protein